MRDNHKVTLVHPQGRPIQVAYYDDDLIRRRLSTGTYDHVAAERMRREIEAKLVLGQPVRESPEHQAPASAGPDMLWDDFVAAHDRLHIQKLRAKSQSDLRSRIRRAAEFLKPQSLRDIADTQSLESLQSHWRDTLGSAHTVRGYMIAVMSVIKWAVQREWLPKMPHVDLISTSTLRQSKGRPITTEEFERMLAESSRLGYVGLDRIMLAAAYSGLRLKELCQVHWSDIRFLVPNMRSQTLRIEATAQKNNTTEAIPMTPQFMDLLRAVPVEERTGWVFVVHGLRSDKPLLPEAVGKAISLIGRKARVFVSAKKPASAHDLRRRFAAWLDSAGMSTETIQLMMRHADIKTTRQHYLPANTPRMVEQLQELRGTEVLPLTEYVEGDV